jgi:uncharacterized protein
MMLRYLKNSFFWFYLLSFKTITFQEMAEELPWDKKLGISFRVGFIIISINLLLFCVVGIYHEFFITPFEWIEALWIAGKAFGVILGIVLLYSLGSSLFISLFRVVISNLLFILLLSLTSFSFAVLSSGLIPYQILGIFYNLILGFLGSQISRLYSGLDRISYSGLTVFLVFFSLPVSLLYTTVNAKEYPREVLLFFGVFAITYVFAFFRFFYVIPHLILYFLSKKKPNLSFKLFRNSPIYWDELITLTLPLLSDWLIQLVEKDRKRGLDEIKFVTEKRPHQRNAAQKALLTIVGQNLQGLESISELKKAKYVVQSLPSLDSEASFREDWFDIKRRMNKISDSAQDYEKQKTLLGKLNSLENIHEEIAYLRKFWSFAKHREIFNPLTDKWWGIVEKEKAKYQKKLEDTPIPNPYIAGIPLGNSEKTQKIFMGRLDIVTAIEENIVSPKERNALLLYGRRRIGKTSTLKNLSRFLKRQYLTVFIDCQNARWGESDIAFCYNLIKEISNELYKNELVSEPFKVQIEEFEKHTFTKFSEWLDEIEKISEKLDKKILLTFDEYEKLEKDFEKSKITTAVFDQLRTIVQHRKQVVVLFSGGHHFEELRKVNWSDYLINTKTLELSFLSKEEASKLLTEPVPNLNYQKDVKNKIIELTHCQPYLLQSFGSELVNYLNAEKRFTATQNDYEKIVEKVLISAQSYFHNTWSEDMSEEEQEIMRILANEGEKDAQGLPLKNALKKLIGKEVVEEINGKCKLTIELFRLYLLKKKL